MAFGLTCSAPAHQSCQITGTLATVETLAHGDPIAVGTPRRLNKHQRTVVVARKRTAIPAGRDATLTITLNAKGHALLERFHKLPVTMTVRLSMNHMTVGRKFTISRRRSDKHK